MTAECLVLQKLPTGLIKLIQKRNSLQTDIGFKLVCVQWGIYKNIQTFQLSLIMFAWTFLWLLYNVKACVQVFHVNPPND